MKVRRLLIGSVTVLALGLAAACGGGGAGEEATPTPTPVVLPEGSETFESWTVDPARPGAIDLRFMDDETLRAIQEAVERHEQMRVTYSCTLSLEGLPMHEVATERRIAAIEQFLEQRRLEDLCEVFDATVVAYYTELSADAAFVYLEGTGTSRYFDRTTGEEVREPATFQASPALMRLLRGEDGRWRVDRFGPVLPEGQQQQE